MDYASFVTHMYVNGQKSLAHFLVTNYGFTLCEPKIHRLNWFVTKNFHAKDWTSYDFSLVGY
jgi:hypothetical protein